MHHSSSVLASRIVFPALRNLTNGVLSTANPLHHADAAKNHLVAFKRRRDARLVSVVSGLPKDLIGGSRFRRGQFGDDAWFSIRHKTSDVLGVADGVGGWRQYGIDPGDFSYSLMQACERIVKKNRFEPGKPERLLAKGFFELMESKRQILGSSTACVVILSRDEHMLFAASIGDSGFLIMRRGSVIHRSTVQQHYFNAPYQLALPPPGQTATVISDSPDVAETTRFKVENGDIILVATDGVFDNIPEKMLEEELCKVQGVYDPLRLQGIANGIAWMAHRYAFDPNHKSPFSCKAKEAGITAQGGKPDDVTVMLATVAL